MTELKEQLESVRFELANSMSRSDVLKEELEQVSERKTKHMLPVFEAHENSHQSQSLIIC